MKLNDKLWGTPLKVFVPEMEFKTKQKHTDIGVGVVVILALTIGILTMVSSDWQVISLIGTYFVAFCFCWVMVIRQKSEDYTIVYKFYQTYRTKSIETIQGYIDLKSMRELYRGFSLEENASFESFQDAVYCMCEDCRNHRFLGAAKAYSLFKRVLQDGKQSNIKISFIKDNQGIPLLTEIEQI